MQCGHGTNAQITNAFETFTRDTQDVPFFARERTQYGRRTEISPNTTLRDRSQDYAAPRNTTFSAYICFPGTAGLMLHHRI
jgi:hypothetical protein